MAEITISDLTTKVLNGTGVFDVLMQTSMLHLEQEFSKGRIKGTDYANVYLGSMQAVLTQSVQFLLQQQQADQSAEKLAAEIALLIQKTKTEQAQIVDTIDSNPVEGVIGKQKTLYTAQTDGFQQKATKDLAKVFSDIYAIQRSNDDTLSPPSGANHADITKVLIKAAEEVGLTTLTDVDD